MFTNYDELEEGSVDDLRRLLTDDGFASIQELLGLEDEDEDEDEDEVTPTSLLLEGRFLKS